MFLLLLLAPLARVDAARPPVAAEMHERFALLTQARDHVIHGDLASAQARAKDLAEMSTPRRLPDSWRPWLTQLTNHATGIAESADLVTAAIGVGNAAATCGACHTALQGGPGLEGARDIPPQAWQPGQNMPLHKWSVDWMWLGLIAGEEEAWNRGANELASRPVPMMFQSEMETDRPHLERLVGIVGELAGEVPAESRPTILGGLIATCSECHVKSGRGPAAD